MNSHDLLIVATVALSIALLAVWIVAFVLIGREEKEAMRRPARASALSCTSMGWWKVSQASAVAEFKAHS